MNVRAKGHRSGTRAADEFRRTVRAILVVLEHLAAHAGVESNELDLLVEEFFESQPRPNQE